MSQGFLASQASNYYVCAKCLTKARFEKVRKFMAVQRAEKKLIVLHEQWTIVESALNAVFANSSDVYALCALIDDGRGFVNNHNFIKHMGRAMRRGPDVMAPLFGVLCMFILQRRKRNGGPSGPLQVKEVAAAFALRERSEDEERKASGPGEEIV